jgi:hypothetical protein
LGTSWILERDPIWGAVRNDPRFREILTTEHEKIEGQREKLEQMRQRGEVPRRAGDKHTRAESEVTGANR